MFSGAPAGQELDAQVVLASGRLLRLRFLQEGDEEPLRAFVDGLSPRTKYLRFLSHTPRLPESVLRMLTRVDDRRGLALVAVVDTADGGEIVGLGNLFMVDDCRMELGLVVGDEWQRQQVGTELAHRMLLAAHARGVVRFVAHVAWENVAIRRLLQRHATIISARMSGSVTEITFVSRQMREGANGLE